MTISDLASGIAIIASIIGTTFVVVAKLTRVEVMITELRSQMGNYERRISALERRINER